MHLIPVMFNGPCWLYLHSRDLQHLGGVLALWNKYHTPRSVEAMAGCLIKTSVHGWEGQRRTAVDNTWVYKTAALHHGTSHCASHLLSVKQNTHTQHYSKNCLYIWNLPLIISLYFYSILFLFRSMALTHPVCCICDYLHVKQAGDLWPRSIKIMKILTFSPGILNIIRKWEVIGKSTYTEQQNEKSRLRRFHCYVIPL